MLSFASHRRFITAGLISLLGLILLLPFMVQPAAEEPSATQAVEQAWELAQASGTYRYRSQIAQTSFPAIIWPTPAGPRARSTSP